MQYKRFEEMPVWKDTRSLTALIYGLTRGARFKLDLGLRDQIQRSSVSAMSNIAEGYERATRKEFLAFLAYAKGSTGEVRSQLYVALDLGYIDDGQFQEARDLCVSVSTQITRFSQYLKKAVP